MPILSTAPGGGQLSQVSGFWTGSFSYTSALAIANDLLTINFGAGPDSNGIAWILTGLDGWDSPDVAGSIMQRTADHGGWASSQYYAPRVLTLRVEALAPNQATRDLARALFQQVIPVNDLCTFTYNEPIPKFVKLRRSGRITEIWPNLTDVQFSAVVTAPDPRKYNATAKVTNINGLVGQQYLTVGLHGSTFTTLGPGGAVFPNSVSPGILQVTNFGTFESRPVITIFGPVINPGLINYVTGQAVTWNSLVMHTGDRLVVDFDSRSATLNGGYLPADLSSSWWTIWPGLNTIALTRTATDAGGGFMSVAFNDAWI